MLAKFRPNRICQSCRLLLAAAVLSSIIGCEDDGGPKRNLLEEHPGKYVVLTAENFEDVVMNSDKLVMVDFWNTACEPCIEMAPWIADISNEYDGRVVVGKLNTLEWKDIAAEHRALSVPQLLFFKNGAPVEFEDNGAEVNRLGWATKEQMRQVLDELLKRDDTATGDVNGG